MGFVVVIVFTTSYTRSVRHLKNQKKKEKKEKKKKKKKKIREPKPGLTRSRFSFDSVGPMTVNFRSVVKLKGEVIDTREGGQMVGLRIN